MNKITLNKTYTINIYGLGYIGLPTAAVLAKNKIKVNGVEINEKIVRIINSGKIHIIEPDLEGLVKTVIERQLLTVTLNPQKADIHLIAVPTPFKENHLPDLSYVKSAAKTIIPLLKPNDLFIIESTCPIGTTENIKQLIFANRPELENNIFIAYCPERVLPGNIIYELENNDRVIGGINYESTKKAVAFYQNFVKGELHETNAQTAEMCKLVENASRDVQVAFANELSMIADAANINVWELIKLANKHPRVNILQPGTGVGGHCIAVDPWFIIKEFKENAKLITQARDVNTYKTEWVIGKIISEINNFKKQHKKEPVLGIMGLAFKPNIDDLRESPALYVAKTLKETLSSKIIIAEPNITNSNDFTLQTSENVIHNADIIAFLVGHREFKNMEVDNNKIILDFCGIRQK